MLQRYKKVIQTTKKSQMFLFNVTLHTPLCNTEKHQMDRNNSNRETPPYAAR